MGRVFTPEALTSQTTLNIGRSAAGISYLAGTVDEIAVHNRALTPAMVASHLGAR